MIPELKKLLKKLEDAKNSGAYLEYEKAVKYSEKELRRIIDVYTDDGK